MSRTDLHHAELAANGRSVRSRLTAGLSAAALSICLLVGPSALAQADELPLAGVLPASTLVAMFAQPGAPSTDVFEDLMADLDLDEARETMRKLGNVFEEAADELFGTYEQLQGTDDLGELFAEYTADCPMLAEAFAGTTKESLAGSLAVGFSAASFNPVPSPVLALRAEDSELGTALFEAVTSCYDSGVAMSEGDVPLYVLADGSDLPVIVAKVGNTMLASGDPEITRAMVRLARGNDEPSLLDTRVGRLGSGILQRDVAITLNLSGLADVLEPFLPMLDGGEGEVRPLTRLLATFRIVNGVAAGASLDQGGLIVDAVVSFDQRAAEASGEQALVDMLNCSGCVGSEPSLIPVGAASVGRWSFSLTALAQWLDSWLADIGPVIGEDLSLDGLAMQFLGVETGTLGLDWLGDTWHVAQLDVYGTDVAAWLQGAGTVTTVPVSSEEEARAGLDAWLVALDNAPALLAEMVDEEDMGDSPFGDSLDLLSTVSIRTASYRGVDYDRVRTPFSGDYGVAVLAGQLVFTQPASAMQAVIDVYLGAPNASQDPLFGPLIASQPPAPASYEIIDLPRYLHGLASITDLGAGPLASTMMIATWAAVEELNSEDEAGQQADIEAEDLPNFDDYIGLADLGTEFLELLAGRTGLVVGSSESIDGVNWSTWRLPLR